MEKSKAGEGSEECWDEGQQRGGMVIVFYRAAREGAYKMVTFEQNLEGGKEARHSNI